jgi:hypothetical protein
VAFPAAFHCHFLPHFRRLFGRIFWLRERVLIERVFPEGIVSQFRRRFLLQFAAGVETARASFFPWPIIVGLGAAPALR